MANSNWVNVGDISPYCGQLWIKDESPDQDYAECIEIIGPDDLESLSDNQVLVVMGSIYMPINDPDKVASALDVTGMTPTLATWLDLAIAFNAYHGIDQDIFAGNTILQVGNVVGDVGPYVESEQADIILHGNTSLDKYIRENYLT